MMVKCNHEHGDTVEGLWVCGQCWRVLDERPRTYIMVPVSNAGPNGDGMSGNYRQEVVLCPSIKTKSGLTLSVFIYAVARRLMARCKMNKSDAALYAIDIMRGYETEFGSGEDEWDVELAWVLVEEDMQYWDEEDQSND